MALKGDAFTIASPPTMPALIESNSIKERAGSDNAQGPYDADPTSTREVAGT